MHLYTQSQATSIAYVFWMASLIFGLPLLSSFYVIQFISNYVIVFLVPYVLVSLIIGVMILRRRESPNHLDDHEVDKASKGSSTRYGLFVAALSFATLAVLAYGVMKYFIQQTYPAPSASANYAAVIYLTALSGAIALGFPYFIARVIPSVRSSLRLKLGRISFSTLAVLVGIGYFITYMILVNQILIVGYNTLPSNVIPSPTGAYPYSYAFTSGPSPSASLESLVYVPYFLIQFNPTLNLALQPFEIVFAVLMSTLVAATFIVTLGTIKARAGHSCVTGATVSGLGGFVGLTATCPSCLAPTLISVFFGGFSGAVSTAGSYTIQTAYSSLAGVIVPPLVSIASLGVALYLLAREFSKSRNLALS